MNAFAIFGNPVEHSKSPKIYSLFANQIKISDKYDLKLASEKNFSTMLLNFFCKGGLGANITMPFKERALFLCDELTDRAMIANAVNTIKKRKDNTLLGDNTDGIGFMSDLKRLHWIHKDNSYINNNDYNSPIINILIIGAGGAAKGIISTLLNIKNCHVNIVNRTLSRAKQLVYYYHSIGRQNISFIDLTKLSYTYNKVVYNLIINTTSSSINNNIPLISSSLITCTAKCYDLFYHSHSTSFITWCKKNGADYCSDGLGMLVEQAAHSFYLWHNVFPSTVPVLKYLEATFRI